MSDNDNKGASAYSAIEAEFMEEVWKALKEDHSDLTRQGIILRAFREAVRAEIARLRK